MNARWLRRPLRSRQLKLLAFASVWRLILVWLIVLPIYETLSNSPILHGSATDRELLQRGFETLLALMDARWTSLRDGTTALTLLLAIAGVLAAAAACLIWVAADDSVPIIGAQVRHRVRTALPAFVAVAMIATALVFVAGWSCGHTLPAIGAMLEPRLGERGTDYVELVVTGGFISLSFALSIFADLVRTHLAMGRVLLNEAIPLAIRLYRCKPIGLACGALWRTLLAGCLHLTTSWIIARFGWLGRSHGWTLAAVAVSECSIVAALWLRLDWIARLSALRLAPSPHARERTRKCRAAHATPS